MSDLSHRLRESAKATFYDPLKSELNEAASHIEKLEAALREIVEQIKQYDLPAPVVTLFVLQKASKALEEKDD
jgi:ppGpp synthetase/RelA/SpoT-type nucleotidyltranferase